MDCVVCIVCIICYVITMGGQFGWLRLFRQPSTLYLPCIYLLIRVLWKIQSFCVCLFVALFVCSRPTGHSSRLIFTKLYVQLGTDTTKNWFNFESHPLSNPNSGLIWRKVHGVRIIRIVVSLCRRSLHELQYDYYKYPVQYCIKENFLHHPCLK